MKIVPIPPTTEFRANCYLLIDEKTGLAAIVDPGLYDGGIKNALAFGKFSRLEYILLTHGHFDHILGVSALKDASGAKTAIHSADADKLLDPVKSLCEGNSDFEQTPVKADVVVGDGDEITLGEEKIKVLHTPGHTSGSVCYILENDGVILSGDSLFCMTAGRTDLPDGNPEKMKESLLRLAALEGDYRVLPGHNRETTLEKERKRNWVIRRLIKNF